MPALVGQKPIVFQMLLLLLVLSWGPQMASAKHPLFFNCFLLLLLLGLNPEKAGQRESKAPSMPPAAFLYFNVGTLVISCSLQMASALKKKTKQNKTGQTGKFSTFVCNVKLVMNMTSILIYLYCEQQLHFNYKSSLDSRLVLQPGN